MNLRRLRAGEWLATLAGGALLADLFAAWYQRGAEALNAFAAFSVLDVVLVAAAFAALAYGTLTALRRGPSLPLAAGVATLLLAAIGVIAVAWRLFDAPGAGSGSSLAPGAWIGLTAVLGALVGAWVGLRDENRPDVDPPTPVELRPGPRVPGEPSAAPHA